MILPQLQIITRMDLQTVLPENCHKGASRGCYRIAGSSRYRPKSSWHLGKVTRSRKALEQVRKSWIDQTNRFFCIESYLVPDSLLCIFLFFCFLCSRIHTYGNALKAVDHPDSRAIMFERETYSKRKIIDFLSVLDGFEEALKVSALFQGVPTTLTCIHEIFFCFLTYALFLLDCQLTINLFRFQLKFDKAVHENRSGR